jgi:hypothetical protein
MNPGRAKNEIATEALAAVNRRLRNSRTSITGLSVTRSTATSAPSSARPAASTPKVTGEAQPQPGAWMTP